MRYVRAVTSPLGCHVCQKGPVRDLDPGRRTTPVSSKIPNKFQHAEGFANAVPMLNRFFDAKSVVEQLCGNSKLFVHIVTYSIDILMLDYLANALQRGVEVAGFIGHQYKPSSDVRQVVTDLTAQFPQRMTLKVFKGSDANQIPHQKILVCDGCLALTGSMNFTKAGFEKHFQDPPCEFVWPFLDLDSVADINNKYISPLFVPTMARQIREGSVGHNDY